MKIVILPGDGIGPEITSVTTAVLQAASKRYQLHLELLHDSAGLDSLRTKVEELYLQGYILKDRDPAAAAEKFRIVIEAAPEGSEVKEKAEAQLSSMQP